MSLTSRGRCPICGATIMAAKTTFSVDKGETLIVVRDGTATVF